MNVRQAVILTLLLVLSGCASAAEPEPEIAPEAQVRASAFQALENIRRLNQDPAEPMSLSFGREASLEDPKSLLPAILGEFTYRIDAVVLDETQEEAVVTITMRRKNVGEALLAWMQDLKQDRTQLRALSALPKEKQEEVLQQQLLETIQTAPPQDCAVALPFVTERGDWTLTEEGQAVLSAALRGE